jgi:hypothetical protein
MYYPREIHLVTEIYSIVKHVMGFKPSTKIQITKTKHMWHFKTSLLVLIINTTPNFVRDGTQTPIGLNNSSDGKPGIFLLFNGKEVVLTSDHTVLYQAIERLLNELNENTVEYLLLT